MGVSPRFLTLVAVLTLVLLLPLLGACNQEGADQPDQDAGDRSTSSLFGGSTSTPEATQDSLPGGSGDKATETPSGSSEVSSTLSSPEGTTCPQRQPDPDALIPPSGTSPETDRDALIALFEATDGETWDASDTWAGLSPVGEWSGVSVGGITPSGQPDSPTPVPADQGRVTGLELSGLAGELPAELGNLTSLQTLSITGSEITGELPSELGNLTSLEVLRLEGNQLCGEIPPELGNLTSLQTLLLGYNQLTGRLPDELARLAKLETLSLADNQLTGKVPSWLAGLSELTALDLSTNRLEGELPTELEQLVPGLESLYLRDNQLTGCYSEFMRDFVSIGSSLDVCSPKNHAGDMEALIALDQAWGQLGLRNWLSDEPISEWQGVSVGFDGRVAGLSLGGLPSEVPAELGNLTGLRALILDGGYIGELPAELGNLVNLRELNLSDTDLSGEIPAELGNLTGLRTLVLEGGFTGELPTWLDNLPNLRTMRISTSEAGGLRCSPDVNWQQGTVLDELCGLEFASVSAGGYWHTCGVKTNGAVACWGIESHLQLAPPEGEFSSVSTGGFSSRDSGHTCGVRTNGAVVCWGNDVYGEATPPEGEFASVSASGNYTCGVRTNGAVVCWGLDEYGQSTPPEGEFASVSAGSFHACGLKTDGAVACWGNDAYGETTPPEGKFASVSAGGGHTCGVRTNGAVVCWGYDRVGQSTPPEGEFTSVSASRGGKVPRTCGVRADGAVACWGENAYGRQAKRPEGKFASVSVGGNYTCGVRTDGSVICWEGPAPYHQATPPGKFASVITIEDGALCVASGGLRICGKLR